MSNRNSTVDKVIPSYRPKRNLQLSPTTQFNATSQVSRHYLPGFWNFRFTFSIQSESQHLVQFPTTSDNPSDRVRSAEDDRNNSRVPRNRVLNELNSSLTFSGRIVSGSSTPAERILLRFNPNFFPLSVVTCPSLRPDSSVDRSLWK